MKRKFLVLCISTLGVVQLSYAQKHVSMELPDRLYIQGKEMFLDNNYVGCINTLREYQNLSKDVKRSEDAEYMILSSLFYRGQPGIEEQLKDYLEKYPSSSHRNQLAFFIGSIHFQNKDWQKSLYWLSQSDIDYLSESEQEDHTYRSAYTHLQAGDKRIAREIFEILNRKNGKYKDPASYYLAYLNFQDGKYADAVPVLRALKNNPEYKEKASIFLIQSTFMENNTQEVIAEGNEYLRSYPNSENSTEVYRLLGSSYYRTGNTAKAIENYERYVSTTDSPLREDMYQLGKSYYQVNDYVKAINSLKQVASNTDLIGQAGNMLLGQSYLGVNDSPNALMSFDAAARSEFSPTVSEEALYNYVMLMNQGAVSSFGESLTAFKRFYFKYPNSKYISDINNSLASTLLSVKNYRAALDAINEINTPGKPILEAKQIILYQLGVQEFIDGNYTSAVDNFNRTIELGDYDMNAKNEAFFWRGDARYRLGDYSTALNDYTVYTQVASQSSKNYAIAFYNLGYANYQEKKYSAALGNFKKYISAEKDSKVVTYSDALNRIGDCYLYSRNFSEAEKYYGQAQNSDPASADYSEFQKAFVLGLQHKYAQKITVLDNMMSKYPNSQYFDNALYEKSRALVMLNRESDAINVLEKMMREYPKTNLAPKAGIQLGQLYFNTNNSQKSIAAYKQVISSYPNTDEARTAIKSLEGVYKDENDINSYATYLNSLGKGNILSASRQDSLTYLAAENVYMKNKANEAKSAFNQYLKSFPQGVFAGGANFYLGSIAFDAKDYSSALSNFKEVIRVNDVKHLDDALIYVSGIEFENKDYDAAYKTYEHLSQAGTTAENKNVGELGMLRCAYLMQKDNEVIAAAGKLLKNDKLSDDLKLEARFYRGRSLNNIDKKSEAIADLQAVTQNTRTAFGAEANFILADIHYKSGAYDKAETQATSFMKAGTSHEYWLARTIIVLADTYQAKGDSFQARQYLESLQANYKGKEQDISKMITERLSKLDKQ